MKDNNYTMSKLKQFVVKKVDYYHYVFNEFDEGKRKIIINNAILCFGSLWFFYRKMYVIGIVLLLYPFCLALLSVVLQIHSIMSCLLVFIVFTRILATYFGNRLYWYKWNAFVACRVPTKIMLLGTGVNLFIPILIVMILLLFVNWLLTGMMQGMRHT